MFYERGIPISARSLVLFLGDMVCLVASVVLAALLRLGITDGWWYIQNNLGPLVVSCLVFLMVFYVSGMYERRSLTHKEHYLLMSSVSVVISLMIIILIFYARFELLIGRGVLFLGGGLILLSTGSIRYLYRVVAGYGLFSKNTLIVGEGQDALNVIRLLRRTEDSGYRVYGVVTGVKSKMGDFLEGVPILGNISKLREFVEHYRIESVIVATSSAREPSLLRVLRPLRYAGVQLQDYASCYEQLAQEIPIDHIDDEWLMHAALNSSRIHIRKIKRIMDVAVSVIGLIVTAPACLVAAMLIKLDSPGAILYRQRRAGLDGRVYTLIKFRTMKTNAEAGCGAVWADPQDRRITRVGRVLRKVRIDEIPQLVNVLRGEMSLVGPRPERPEFITALSEAIPFYRERLLVPPGITGWAQIRYPYAASIEAARRKLQFDLYYIKHMSLFLDTVILLKTFKTIMIGLRHSEADELDAGEPVPAGDLFTVLPGGAGRTGTDADAAKSMRAGS